MEESLWSSNGRIPRKVFWIRTLICWGINMVLGFTMGIIGGVADMDPSSINLLANVVSLPVSVFMILQSAKRMHDVGKSGWYQLIPIYNLVLFCTAGNQGPNEYGADPLNPSLGDQVSTFE